MAERDGPYSGGPGETYTEADVSQDAEDVLATLNKMAAAHDEETGQPWQEGQEGAERPYNVDKRGIFQYDEEQRFIEGKPVKRGDWLCHKCGNHNFASRLRCNNAVCKATKQGTKEGDFVCKICRMHNYSNRSHCRSCSEPRDILELMETVKQMSQNKMNFGNEETKWKQGDWECWDCGFHNYAKNVECSKCKSKAEMITLLSQFIAAKGVEGLQRLKGAKGKGGKGMGKGAWICIFCGEGNDGFNVCCEGCDRDRPGFKRGDWVCPKCKTHNFAKRMDCKRCENVRPLGSDAIGAGSGDAF